MENHLGKRNLIREVKAIANIANIFMRLMKKIWWEDRPDYFNSLSQGRCAVDCSEAS